jgi:glycosyltransferase involved in cell wall biosynthesis
MSRFISEMVSVVIPSRNRPKLVSQAVRSALAQTVQLIEVIVVIDGPDPATVNELAQISDPRLKTIELLLNIGPASARNTGIRAAQGIWIAFLDDDDEWLPFKIERQLEVAYQSIYAMPIISSRFFAHTARGDFVWPERLPDPSESVSEYLFIRNSLFLGETFIVTPTILARKELLEKFPFNSELSRHEDLDWLIRASLDPAVGIEFVSEPMAIVNMIHTSKRQSLSNVNDWQYSLEWINSLHKLISPKAYSGFIITVVGSQAAAANKWQAFTPLLWKAIRLGKPRPFDILLYLLMWFLPQDTRQRLRSLLTTSRIIKGNINNKNEKA